jgi:hypothetical protein
MGYLVRKKDRWLIDGTDEIKVGDTIEIRFPGESWKIVKVGKDAQENFFPEPDGEPLRMGMEIRRTFKKSHS